MFQGATLGFFADFAVAASPSPTLLNVVVLLPLCTMYLLALQYWKYVDTEYWFCLLAFLMISYSIIHNQSKLLWMN